MMRRIKLAVPVPTRVRRGAFFSPQGTVPSQTPFALPVHPVTHALSEQKRPYTTGKWQQPIPPMNPFTQARRNISIQVHHVIQHLNFMSTCLSDHHLFLQPLSTTKTTEGKPMLIPSHVGINREYYIANLNMMMQGKYNETKKRYNNAYELNESDEHYRARIEEIIQALGNMVKRYEDKGRVIPIICVQEAPITEAHIAFIEQCIKDYFPEDFNPWISTTPWGNMIIVDTAHFPYGIELNPTAYSGVINDLNTRMTTLQLTQNEQPIPTRLTNLHLPHDNPEYALEVIANNIAQSIIRQILNGVCQASEIYIGDWNLRPEIIERAVYDKLYQEFPPDLDVNVDLTLSQSPEGHIKANKETVTVDSSLCITIALDPLQLEAAQTWAKEKFDNLNPDLNHPSPRLK